MASDDDSNHITLSPAVLTLLLGGTFAGGGGLYGAAIPHLDKAALAQCFDNSSTALMVAAQHGQEFVELRTELNRLQRHIDDRTRYRWTAEDESKYQIGQQGRDARQDKIAKERHDSQDKRMNLIERQLDKHLHETK